MRPSIGGNGSGIIAGTDGNDALDGRGGDERGQERIGGAHSASPLFADGKVYFQSEDGMGIVAKLEKPAAIDCLDEANVSLLLLPQQSQQTTKYWLLGCALAMK